MNLKLIRIAFRIFKMIKFTITIHAGGIKKVRAIEFKTSKKQLCLLI